MRNEKQSQMSDASFLTVKKRQCASIINRACAARVAKAKKARIFFENIQMSINLFY